jgi:hypothetical protein
MQMKHPAISRFCNHLSLCFIETAIGLCLKCPIEVHVPGKDEHIFATTNQQQLMNPNWDDLPIP